MQRTKTATLPNQIEQIKSMIGYCEDKINEIVYGLYGLTEEEIKMIEKWCVELSHKFSDIVMDTYIIMPNHFHAIIINNGEGNPAAVAVGADLRVCPDTLDNHDISGNKSDISGNHGNQISGEHTGSPLHRVVQWFKTMSTNEYIRGVKTLGWQPFDKKLWQRNYWEHIIRNEQSCQRIANYIINNPTNWLNDNFYEN